MLKTAHNKMASSVRRLVILLLFCWVHRTTTTTTTTPSDCSYEAVGQLTCRLSSINSRLERTDFSVVPNATTSRLRVLCADSRSLGRLEPAGFATLGGLQELSIEGCALASIPADAFKGNKLVLRVQKCKQNMSFPWTQLISR